MGIRALFVCLFVFGKVHEINTTSCGDKILQ